MREFSIESGLEKILEKLKRKDETLHNAVLKKIEEILQCDSVNHYKNLRRPMQRFKRIHVRNSLVLIFQYKESEHSIVFFHLDHHDKIYT